MNRLRWLGAAVLVVAVGAGMLWLLWPQQRPPIVAEATAGPYLVRLKDDPPKVGVSSLVVEILGSAGETPTPDSVRFEPRMPQMGLASPAVEAVPEGQDDYRGDIDLSTPGQWDITVRIGSGPQSYDAVLHVTAKR
ncbi:FixH family protein [Mycobacterium sp. 48b]|uniref:FixH family protein n=1 Tax=Mycobacterium sp. 48b TaxID=3400426 RepID=UPI003AAA7638